MNSSETLNLGEDREEIERREPQANPRASPRLCRGQSPWTPHPCSLGVTGSFPTATWGWRGWGKRNLVPFGRKYIPVSLCWDQWSCGTLNHQFQWLSIVWWLKYHSSLVCHDAGWQWLPQTAVKTRFQEVTPYGFKVIRDDPVWWHGGQMERRQSVGAEWQGLGTHISRGLAVGRWFGPRGPSWSCPLDPTQTTELHNINNSSKSFHYGKITHK